jgi:acetoin utilization protein AcuB
MDSANAFPEPPRDTGFDPSRNASETRRAYRAARGGIAMIVQQFMTPDPVVVHPETTLPEAADLMKRGRFRRMPVVRADGELLGIVTDRDIKQAMPSDATSLSIWEINYLIPKIKIAEIMTAPVHTVLESAPLEHAARMMLDNKIGGMPVMNGDRVVGMLTATDILRAFVQGRPD